MRLKVTVSNFPQLSLPPLHGNESRLTGLRWSDDFGEDV
jgi:hypothetical protein